MNASGLIETAVNFKSPPRKPLETIPSGKVSPESSPVPTPGRKVLEKKLSTPVLSSEKIVLSSRSNSDLGMKASLKNLPLQKAKSLETEESQEKYSRLCESRSITPSPPPPQVPLLQLQKNGSSENASSAKPGNLSPIPSSNDSSPTNERHEESKPDRPKLLNVPALLFVGRKSKGNQTNNRSTTPSPCELKPIFEAESPDELALVDAAHSYDCRLLKRTPISASLIVPGKNFLTFLYILYLFI